MGKQLEDMARDIGVRTVPRGERHDFVAKSFQLREMDLGTRAAFMKSLSWATMISPSALS